MRSVATRAVVLLVMVALVGCNPPTKGSGPIAAESPTAAASTTAPATTAAATSAAPTATAAATTAAPTQVPTQAPTATPTATAAPTQAPTQAPIVAPTTTPTPAPTPTPSLAPTSTPAPALSVNRYLQSTDLPPACPVSASDAPVCAVNFPQPTNYQASAGEYVLFRVGWADASSASCDAFVRNTSTTMTVDGRAVAWVWVPCRFATSGPNAQTWLADMRYLSAPLAPGTHTATATIVYNAAVPATSGAPVPAGTTQTWTRTVTVN